MDIKHLSKRQAASFLGMPVRQFEKLEIHRCPEGYDMGRLEAFAAQHELPVEGVIDAAADAFAPAHPRWARFMTTEEALYHLGSRLRVLFLSSASDAELRRLRGLSIHLVGVGFESPVLHDSTPNWEEAKTYP